MPALAEKEKKELFTYEDIDKLPEGNYEIIDGRIKSLAPTGFEHGNIEGLLFNFLHSKLKDKGYIAVGEVGILIQKDPLRIRAADIVYISKEKAKEKPKGILEVVPDLVIEILSPSNTVSEMEEKIEDYFKIKIEKVIIISPEHKKVYIHKKDKNIIETYSFKDKIEFINKVEGKLEDIIE
jgi:Uma2 family endonuclease